MDDQSHSRFLAPVIWKTNCPVFCNCVIFRFVVVQCTLTFKFIPDRVTSKAAHLGSIVYVSEQKLFDYDRNKSYLWVYRVISIGNNRELCAWQHMVSRHAVRKNSASVGFGIWMGWVTSLSCLFLRRFLRETIPIEISCNEILVNWLFWPEFQRCKAMHFPE